MLVMNSFITNKGHIGIQYSGASETETLKYSAISSFLFNAEESYLHSGLVYISIPSYIA